MNKVFVSWIPNIVGRLSFSLIGKSQFPGRADVFHFRPESNRFFYCAQERFLADSSIPFVKSFLSDSFLGINTSSINNSLLKRIWRGNNFHFIYIFCGREGDEKPVSAKILGDVIVFVVEDINKDWDICAKIKDYYIENKNLNILSDGFFSKFKQLVGVFPIEVNRNGAFKCTIDLSDNIEDPTQEQIDNYGLQIYSFIRDIFHSHYHHYPNEDSLISVFKYHETCDKEKSCQRWQMEAFHNLLRAVMKKRSGPYKSDQAQAFGILQYAKVLSHLFLRESSEADNMLPDYAKPYGKGSSIDINFEFLENSINSKMNTSKDSESINAGIKESRKFILNIAISIAALLFAISGLLQIGGADVANYILYCPETYTISIDCKGWGEPKTSSVARETWLEANGALEWSGPPSKDPYKVNYLWKFILLKVFHNPTSLFIWFSILCSFAYFLPFLSVGFSKGDKKMSSLFVRDWLRLAISFARNSDDNGPRLAAIFLIRAALLAFFLAILGLVALWQIL